ncbi:MAG TPA: helix-turn-helix domain-containing protein [Sphingomicrobium sp.]|nr:helix-turn-helix domain-containing protein [Sphingomicrobium sp.]
MGERTYGQFCPVAMAADVLCTRWTIVILRELLAGSTRFNELRRGMPRISPALLSQRLKDLEHAGIVERKSVASDPGLFEYSITPAGRELRPVIEYFGRWGQRWISSKLCLEQLDAQLLMWDLRRNMRLEPPPEGRRIIQFLYKDAPTKDRNWWVIVNPGQPVDVCSIDPGFDVDLYVAASLRTMTSIWMGHQSFASAVAEEGVIFTGDRQLAGQLQSWMLLSPFATEERHVA